MFPVIRLAKPSIVGSSIVDRLVAFENLTVDLALVVIPDLAPRLREDGFDRQKEAHLLRFEDAALRINERNALTLKHKAWLQLGRGQVIVTRVKETVPRLEAWTKSEAFRAAQRAETTIRCIWITHRTRGLQCGRRQRTTRPRNGMSATCSPSFATSIMARPTRSTRTKV